MDERLGEAPIGYGERVQNLAIVVLMLVWALLLPGCSSGCRGKGEPPGRAQVVVTIFPVYDLVRRIAGPDADVALIVPPGQSAHGFQPRPGDVEVLSRMRLGVMVGLGLDEWMDAFVPQAPKGARVLKIGDRVPQLAKGADSDDANTDPHVWLDPQRAQLIVRAVTDELGRVDPSHVLAYRERAKSLDASLAQLDHDAETRLAKLPKRSFLTHHLAFSYFAERYGLNIAGSRLTEPPKPAPDDHVRSLRTAASQRSVVAVFREPQLDQGPIQTFASDAALRLGVLDPLGGGPDTGTYEALIRFNVSALEAQLR